MYIINIKLLKAIHRGNNMYILVFVILNVVFSQGKLLSLENFLNQLNKKPGNLEIEKGEKEENVKLREGKKGNRQGK